MGRLCIAGVDDNPVLKDFVRAHVEFLQDEKICIDHHAPDFVYNGRRLRFFHSTHPLQRKIRGILPHAVYARMFDRPEVANAERADALRAFFTEYKVDCILAEFGTTGASIAPAAEAAGIPLVVHFHGHDAHRASVVNEYRSRYCAMFEYAHAVLAVSKYMVDTLVNLGAERSKIVYNPYGPRDKFYALRTDYRPSLLAVGRFTDIKANYLTLAAFKEACYDVPDARLVMVGDGELLETCKTLARAWGIADRVEFTGSIAHAEVDRRFEQSCAFVQHSVSPSYGDAEGTPVTILEAQASALPVVATRHAGIPDVVVHERTGFLVDELDIAGMASWMNYLLKNPELCRTLGMAARDHVRRNFSLSQHIRRVQDAIDGARASRIVH
jgi:glycosyltransferase involved in cell wall biosynthesis